MENIQQIADAVQKGLWIIVRASVQQGRARLTCLRNELCSDSFHAVLAWSCGRAKCQCCTATVTVVVYMLSILVHYLLQKICQWIITICICIFIYCICWVLKCTQNVFNIMLFVRRNFFRNLLQTVNATK